MVWSDVSPNGSISVNANTSSMQANTAYIETTMKRDHYWNEGTDEDGHHKQIQITKLSADATVDTGMNGVMYIKEASASNTRIEGFYRNADGIYQYIPSFQEGSALSISSSYANVTTVPDNCYGNIYMYRTDAADMAYGFFKATGGVVNSFSCATFLGSGDTAKLNLVFANSGEASDLNIKAKTSTAGAGSYDWKVIYWAM